MKTLLIFAAVCLAVAYSQILVPCTAPSVWEARVSRTDPKKQYSVRAKFSYDAANRRVRIIDQVNLQKETDFFDVLYLFDTGTEYYLNLKTKECEKKELPGPFRPLQVPPNATFLGEEYIGIGGVPGAGVLTELWEAESKEEGKFFGVYTVEGCIPIQVERYSNSSGLETTYFFDVTAGISDPNVFVPPKECN